MLKTLLISIATLILAIPGARSEVGETPEDTARVAGFMRGRLDGAFIRCAPAGYLIKNFDEKYPNLLGAEAVIKQHYPEYYRSGVVSGEKAADQLFLMNSFGSACEIAAKKY